MPADDRSPDREPCCRLPRDLVRVAALSGLKFRLSEAVLMSLEPLSAWWLSLPSVLKSANAGLLGDRWRGRYSAAVQPLGFQAPMTQHPGEEARGGGEGITRDPPRGIS